MTQLILTTHYMDEAEQLCDRLLVIDDGRVIARGAPDDLIAEHVASDVVELRFERGQVPSEDAVAGVVGSRARRVEVVNDRAMVATDDADAVLEVAIGSELGVVGTYARRATLEDVFLALTGRQLVE